MAFESVSVICQYKIETNDPLFDVLIKDIVFGDTPKSETRDNDE